ncbi:O-methyltransferase [Streptomyces resistomycificus]|nr:class I SAM-dependent methyltransferase [Streptomyces resistomycificus]
MTAHSVQPDAVQERLARQTRRFAEVAHWQTAPEQSPFLTMLVQTLGVHKAVEVGTFTGMSALAIARGLQPGGTLLCCDVDDTWTPLARQAWQDAGVEDRIELRIAPALETLRLLPNTADVDFSFVDAEKTGYWDYFNELVVRTRPGGLLVFDNVFRKGRVLHPSSEVDDAIIEFNKRLAGDDRVDVVMLPIADGMTIARRKP